MRRHRVPARITTPRGMRTPMTFLLITFNQPRERIDSRNEYQLTNRRPWDNRSPALTGELLLAALKENA